jgi:uncharacterized protein (TIGR02118 family)
MAMIRATVLYPSSATRFDYDYYVNRHTPMVLDLWKPHGLVNVEISKGISGLMPSTKPPYVTITNLTFTSLEALQSALAAAGAQVMADIANFTDVQPDVQLNEILS